MKYTVKKFVDETIEIDLSKPIYRKAFTRNFYRITAGESETDTKTTIISDKSISQINNFSETLNLISLSDRYEESSEQEFIEALNNELQALNVSTNFI